MSFPLPGPTLKCFLLDQQQLQEAREWHYPPLQKWQISEYCSLYCGGVKFKMSVFLLLKSVCSFGMENVRLTVWLLPAENELLPVKDNTVASHEVLCTEMPKTRVSEQAILEWARELSSKSYKWKTYAQLCSALYSWRQQDNIQVHSAIQMYNNVTGRHFWISTTTGSRKVCRVLPELKWQL